MRKKFKLFLLAIPLLLLSGCANDTSIENNGQGEFNLDSSKENTEIKQRNSERAYNLASLAVGDSLVVPVEDNSGNPYNFVLIKTAADEMDLAVDYASLANIDENTIVIFNNQANDSTTSINLSDIEPERGLLPILAHIFCVQIVVSGPPPQVIWTWDCF